MEKITADDSIAQSADVVSDNLSKLAELFPEAMVEGNIDFEVLKQLLGGAVDERDERYGLNWHGKRQARQLSLTPSIGTLRPCPEESVHWDTTQNLMIEGDNLEVLKLLQKSYSGKVKLIYIDPPYNTGSDFVYPDNFRDGIQNYLELTAQRDSEAKTTTNSESSGRFHTAWLNMIYPRLRLAKTLLHQDGLIIVSIDDTEVANLRLLMDDIFGANCFVAQLVWKNKYNAGALTRGFSSVHEYILVYCKTEVRSLTVPLGEDEIAQYRGRDSKFETRGGFVTQPLATSSKDDRPNLRYSIEIGGEEIWPDKQWIWEKSRVEAAIANDEVVVNEKNGKKSVRVKQYLRDEEGVMREMKPLSLLIGPFNQEGSKESEAIFGKGVFSFPKPSKLIQWFASLTVNDNKSQDDIVMDFFAGSGTTAQAVLEQNASDGRERRFILVQLPEQLRAEKKEQKAAVKYCRDRGVSSTIAELTKARIRASIDRLRDSETMAKDLGFRVFKLDSSNIESWEPDREDLDASLADYVDHVKDDRSNEDVLYELLLKLGLDLCVPIEQHVISEKIVHSIGVGTIFACLDRKIAADNVEPLAHGIVEWHKQLAPVGECTVVFRDSAFTDDVVKTNLSAIFYQHGLTNVRSL